MNDQTIKITWAAFGDRPDRGKYVRDVTIAIPVTDLDDYALCERVYRDTNLYTGPIWDVLEPVLPADRTHTALSVGDLVEIDGRKYECADFGFEAVTEATSPIG